MAIKIADGLSQQKDRYRRTYLQIIIFTEKKLPWSDVKTRANRVKKMNEIKKNINLKVLFNDCPKELIYIYKNISKLGFSEKQDYKIYIIIYNFILKKFGIDDEKQNNFLKVKINRLFGSRDSIEINLEKKRSIKSVFEGYPLSKLI